MNNKFMLDLSKIGKEQMPPKIIFNDKKKMCYHGTIWTDDFCCRKCFDDLTEYIMEFSMLGEVIAKTFTTKS